MILEIGNYRVEPFPSSRCWQIRTKVATGDNVGSWSEHADCYPWTLDHALTKVYEYMLLEESTPMDDLKEVAALVVKCRDEIISAAKKLEEA